MNLIMKKVTFVTFQSSVAIVIALLFTQPLHAQVPIPEQNFDVSNMDKPECMCTDGKTIWMANSKFHAPRIKIIAYNFFTKQRRPDQDFNNDLNFNYRPQGIWTAGKTMWVSSIGEGKIYAYDINSKLRSREQDFNDLDGIKIAQGIWSDTKIMLVADEYQDPPQILAFNLETKERMPEQDFDSQIMIQSGNDYPQSLWSDGKIMWICDNDLTGRHALSKLNAYTLPGAVIETPTPNRANPINPGRPSRPTRPTSVKLFLKPGVAGAPIKLSFAAKEGKTYELQSSRDFDSWVKVTQVTATSNVITIEDFVVGERRFYRIISQ